MSAVKRAIRDVYGDTLAQLGRENTNIVALDADVGSSSKSIVFGKQFPKSAHGVKAPAHGGLQPACKISLKGRAGFAHTVGFRPE